MKEEEFNKVIIDLVVSLEKAGVYNEELKTTIDRLFDLKELIFLRDSLKNSGSCFRCAFYSDGYCTLISGTVTDSINIELIRPNEKRLKIKVPSSFSCRFYKS